MTTPPPAPPRRRRRRLLPRLLLAAVATIATLEISLRVFDVRLPMANIWRWHATLGWTQLPGGRFDYDMEGRSIRASFNSLGFRDVEHERAKPPGTRRVVVLGDSFCEAMQVNFEETFYNLVERDLDGRGAGDVEVINLGVGDWGQGQQLLALRQLGLDYAPDLVVCQMFPLNDVCNNTIELYGLDHSHNDLYRPYFVDQDGALTVTYRHPWRQTLRCWSRAFVEGERGVMRLLWELEGGSEREKWDALDHAQGFPLSALLSTLLPEDDQPPRIRTGWRRTERLLEEMAALCQAHGVPFAVLVIAWESRVGAAFDRLQRSHPALTVRDAPERRLLRWSQRTGVPVLPMLPVFEAHEERYLPCIDGHLGPGGHRLVADTLLEAIDANGWLRR